MSPHVDVREVLLRDQEIATLRERLAEAERERDGHKERADAFTALRLKRLEIEEQGKGWEANAVVGTTPEAREAFACMVAGILDSEPRAVNYMEIKVTHPAGRDYAVTCQRLEGKTPHEFRLAAESQRDRAVAEASRIYQADGSFTEASPEEVVAYRKGAARRLALTDRALALLSEVAYFWTWGDATDPEFEPQRRDLAVRVAALLKEGTPTPGSEKEGR